MPDKSVSRVSSADFITITSEFRFWYTQQIVTDQWCKHRNAIKPHSSPVHIVARSGRDDVIVSLPPVQ